MFGSEDATSSTGSDSDSDLVMVEDEKAKYEVDIVNLMVALVEI